MRTAIVTQHYSASGGVRPSRDGCVKGSHVGHDVQVHDLVTSSRDQRSRRLLAPRSWWREPSARVSSTDLISFIGGQLGGVQIAAVSPRSELDACAE